LRFAFLCARLLNGFTFSRAGAFLRGGFLLVCDLVGSFANLIKLIGDPV
jgi:hypothetical protein